MGEFWLAGEAGRVEVREGAGVCGALAAGRTSIAARFQRSFVGAVSLSVTGVPLSGVVEVWRCTHKVSPTEARNSSTLVWPGPTVRSAARSQSLPTPQTQEPPRVVVRVAVGAPVAALPPAAAPSTAWSAPTKATTVIEPTKEPLARVAVTVTLVRVEAAFACQISAVPAWVLARRRRRQVSPPPVTPEKLWLTVVGPSEVMNASSTSFGFVVDSAGEEIVVAELLWWVVTVVSTASGGVAVGVTGFEAVESGPWPSEFTAATLNV